MGMQLCQWAFGATQPGHPVLAAVKDEVVTRMQTLPDDTDRVLDRTGPIAWSAAILGYLQLHSVSGRDLAPAEEPDKQGQLFDLRDRHTGEESQLLLLPYRSLGWPGAHDDFLSEEPSSQRLIHHLFEGSWRKPTRHRATFLFGIVNASGLRVGRDFTAPLRKEGRKEGIVF